MGRGITAHGTNSESFPYAFQTEIFGNVRGTTGEVLLDGATVDGSVAGLGTAYVDVYDSTVARALTVTGNVLGGIVCERRSTETRVSARIRTDDKSARTGRWPECVGPSYFGKNLDVSDNTGAIVVSNTIIRGDLDGVDLDGVDLDGVDLDGVGNDPAPTGKTTASAAQSPGSSPTSRYRRPRRRGALPRQPTTLTGSTSA